MGMKKITVAVATRVLLWGADGSALLTAEKPGHVDVTDRTARELGKVSAQVTNELGNPVLTQLIGIPDESVYPLLTGDNPGIVQLSGSLPSLTAGSEVVGKFGIDQTTPGVTNAIQISGANIKYQSVTIMNAVSLAGSGGNNTIYYDIADAPNEIWVLVNIDQQPWIIKASPGFWSYGQTELTDQAFYPVRTSVTTTASSILRPIRSLLVVAPKDGVGGQLFPDYSTFSEAYSQRQGGGLQMRFGITNLSASLATATIRLMKVWRY